MGDVNASGAVDIVDALMTAQYYVSLNPANFRTAYADVDGNNSINIIDALMITQYYVGLITQFPASPQVTPTPASTPTQIPGSVTNIVLNGSTITVNGAGATASGSKVTIPSGGSYSVSGTLNNGQIVVDSLDSVNVILTLNGMNITNSTTALLSIVNAKAVELVLAANTTNTVTDPSTYVYPDTSTDEPNAAIFSTDDLIISGSGTLTVNANYSDGIACKDGLTITGGTITVKAPDDGIRGKDFLLIKNGNITVTAGGDGLKSNNADDATVGYVTIEAGTIKVTSTGDAISAESNVLITNGQFNLTSGGGGNTTVSSGVMTIRQ